MTHTRKRWRKVCVLRKDISTESIDEKKALSTCRTGPAPNSIFYII
jgi:hypothetical protein